MTTRPSKSELNRLVDTYCHKRAERNWRYWLLDFGMHAIIEQDIRQSVSKAARYYPQHLNRFARLWKERHGE